ncbi:MAG: hypothetical protein NZ750_10900 [Anaerolineae bacterium]|nr:hypothetical protein [Anaerolineae bacterium]MDW8171571.1 hypothetical protein [Anaerolineae bacterium]
MKLHFNKVANLLKLSIVTLCITLATFLVFANGIVLSDDGTLHIYRSSLVGQALLLKENLYPRFTSGFALGYGAGLFNFFSPFAYYPIVALQALGLSVESSWKIALAGYFFLAQATTYSLARDISRSAIGGLIASIAYSVSPYLLLDLTSRGSVTELASLAVLPIVLLFAKKLILDLTVQNFAGFVASVILFVPMHNIITVHSLIIATPWAAFWICQRADLSRSTYVLTLAVLISFFATAFFWLPALGETKDIKLSAIATQLDFVDATKHLRSIDQVLRLGDSADTWQLQPQTPISLSLFIIALASLGLWLKKSKGFRGLLTLLLIIVLICAWLNTPLSTWIWQNAPLLGYSQFAWRILGVASLALALAAGLSFAALYNSLRSALSQGLAFWIVALGILLGGYPWFYRPQETNLVRTIQEIHAFEKQTNQFALSSYSEYLPVAARNLSREPLAERFDESPVISRIDPSVEVIQASWSSLGADLIVSAPSPTRLVLDWLYMPGWWVSINEQLVQTYAEGSHGLLAVNIPKGKSNVRIYRTLTPLQQLGTGLSLAAIFLLAPFAWLIVPSTNSSTRITTSSSGLTHGLFLGLTFLVFRLLVDTSGSSIFKLQRWQGERFRAENWHYARLANGMMLLASTEADSSSDGQALELETFWSIYKPSLDRDYSLLYQLVNRQGLVVAEENRFLIGQLPTIHWLENHYVQDKLSFIIPAYTPPGELQLKVTVYDSQTLAPISWLSENGNPQSVSLMLDRVTIRQDMRLFNFPQTSQDVISIVEISGLPEKAQVGDEFILSWLWRLNQSTTMNYSARLLWKCADGTQTKSNWTELIHDYPVHRWQVGDTWRGLHRFYVPGQLETSLCSVSLVVRDNQELEILSFDIGGISVQAPIRTYQMDKVDYPGDAVWQNGIHLVGYDRRDQQLTLYWSSTQPITQSLRLFVQALNPKGQVLWQVDEVPRQWSRPTTSWDVDEIVTTHHIIDVPDGNNFSVIVGWYEPISGARIPLLGSTQDYATMSFLSR